MTDLKEIPDSDLQEAFQEAQVEAGGFVPTNGLIVKCWRSLRAKGQQEAAKAIMDWNRVHHQELLAAPDARQPTPEEREANAKAAAEIARMLAGDR